MHLLFSVHLTECWLRVPLTVSRLPSTERIAWSGNQMRTQYVVLCVRSMTDSPLVADPRRVRLNGILWGCRRESFRNERFRDVQQVIRTTSSLSKADEVRCFLSESYWNSSSGSTLPLRPLQVYCDHANH